MLWCERWVRVPRYLLEEGSVSETDALDQIRQLLVVVHGRHEGSRPGFGGCFGVTHQVVFEGPVDAVWVGHACLSCDGKRRKELNLQRERPHLSCLAEIDGTTS